MLKASRMARLSIISASMVVVVGVAVAQQAPTQPNRDDWLLNAPDDIARFRLLQSELRGFSMAMAEVGQRYQRLYDAIGDKNYDLAVYHWSKIKDAIVAGYTRRPGRKTSADQEFLDKVYQPVLDALKSRDGTKVWIDFAEARKACMACHEKERVAFMNEQPLFRVTEKPPR